MSLSAYHATIAFDDAVWRHGYDSEEAIQARNAAEQVDFQSIEELERAASASKKRGQGAFCRLPNSVVRDKRVSEQTLVLIAYRSTIADDEKAYGLNEKALVKAKIVRSGTGLGINAIRSAIAEAKLLGYIERGQEGRTGKGRFRLAVDRLTLPTCGKTGRAGQIVRREWFDGQLSKKEMAAYLYLRAGAGRGPSMYARELAERFGWSRPTAAQILTRLVDLNLIEKEVARDCAGRLKSTTYKAVSAALWTKSTTVKKPRSGSPCNGKPCNTRNYPLHRLPTEEPSSHTLRDSRGSYASPQSDAPTPNFAHDDLGSVPASKTNFLSWAEGEPYEDDLLSTSEELVDQICDLADDGELRSLLCEATGGRIQPDVTTEDGLNAFRILTAYMLEHPPYEETFIPHDALDYVLSAIRERIGERPNAWLNSLGVIGKRLLAPTIGGDGVDETPYRSKQRKRRKPTPKPTKELKILIEADGARILSPKLRRDPKGLNRLLRKYGPEALDTIKSSLTGAMIYESSVGQVKSWSYFDGPLEDERLGAQFKAQGLRPGDLPGWRNARGNKGRGNA